MRFSISQPLLRSAGIDANVASIRIARYQKNIVDLKYARLRPFLRD
jgi:hypothetical protein